MIYRLQNGKFWNHDSLCGVFFHFSSSFKSLVLFTYYLTNCELNHCCRQFITLVIYVKKLNPLTTLAFTATRINFISFTFQEFTQCGLLLAKLEYSCSSLGQKVIILLWYDSCVGFWLKKILSRVDGCMKVEHILVKNNILKLAISKNVFCRGSSIYFFIV